jgi:hypothetical protein
VASGLHEKALSAFKTVAQPSLKYLVFASRVDVLLDRGSDDLRDRLGVNSCDSLQRISLVAAEPNRHRLGVSHAAILAQI